MNVMLLFLLFFFHFLFLIDLFTASWGALLASDLTPTQMEADLKALTDSLDTQKIKYITLRSTVKIRGARWSQSQ